MRRSVLFLPTERQPPADAEALSHKLMVRAGLVRQLGSGLWSWLPAGWRAHEKAVQIIREEMDGIGGQEMLMPVMHPRELWRRTGRDGIDELFKLKDRKGAEMVLAMTHEEAVTFHVAAGREVLPRPPQAALPLPDQGTRRAASARRRPAHPRVHHEGRLHLRSRPGRAGRPVRGAPRCVRPDLHTGGPGVVRVRVGRRDDGRDGRARVHGAVPCRRGRRGHRRPLRRERRGGVRRAAGRRPPR